MISFKEAENIIHECLKDIVTETEVVSISESTGRILAEVIVSDVDLPPFNNSAMDGYAIKYDHAISQWKIKGENPAGKFCEYKLNLNEAVRIMTGAKLPADCDTVIPVEDVNLYGDSITINQGLLYKAGMNIRRQGEDLALGKTALEKNTLLRPQHIAVLASCGKQKVNVYRKLKIGVLATGDELIDIHQFPEGDKIRCSNLYAIISAIHEMNLIAVDFGIVKDEREAIKLKIFNALNSDIDILITSGGVSVGKYDFVKDIFNELGVQIKFWKANIKPGKPIVFGSFDKGNNNPVLVFGLPGNPVSSLVTFNLFVKEKIYELYEGKRINRTFARLEQDIKKEDNKRHFIRGILSEGSSMEMKVRATGKQSSGNLVQMSKANCLIIIEEERLNPRKGEMVECMII